jgi:hypothetical protein
MSPTFDYHSGVKPLDFQSRGKVPIIHGYHVSLPLEITLGIYKNSLILFQDCVKMKPMLSLVFVLSRSHKYMIL